MIGKKLTLMIPSQNKHALQLIIQGKNLTVDYKLVQKINVVSLKNLTQTTQSLNDLKIGDCAVIIQIKGTKKLRKRLMDIGLTKHTFIQFDHTAS